MCVGVQGLPQMLSLHLEGSPRFVHKPLRVRIFRFQLLGEPSHHSFEASLRKLASLALVFDYATELLKLHICFDTRLTLSLKISLQLRASSMCPQLLQVLLQRDRGHHSGVHFVLMLHSPGFLRHLGCFYSHSGLLVEHVPARLHLLHHLGNLHSCVAVALRTVTGLHLQSCFPLASLVLDQFSEISLHIGHGLADGGLPFFKRVGCLAGGPRGPGRGQR
mmetsp:Transcript_143892/g.261790  ORF Transcript_143892/g.261790 Transcript_143892/m.261790 type:complete len:220 (+) Transcript_143892:1249-1908(+)